MPVKTEAGAARALASRKTPGSLSPEERRAHIAAVTDHEIFVNQKRNEATLRDITGKAVCATKRALRQPGAQADGRPAIPPNWDDVFKPQLGSFMKFVLGRPDQFCVTEGSGPGFYTVENVAGKMLAEPPSWLTKAKGKGKGKSEAKGGKGKKGKGKGGCDGKGKALTPAPPAVPPPLPRGARLLGMAAKEELAGIDKDAAAERDDGLGFEDDFPAEEDEREMQAEAVGVEAAAGEPDDFDEEADALREVERLAATEANEDDEDEEPAGTARVGNLISNLLSSGPRKRKLF